MLNLHSAFLSRFSKVSPTSPEWARLSYTLQMGIGSTALIVRNIWSISNAHLNMIFEKNTKGLLMLESFLDTTMLDDDNNLERICSQGFNFPEHGLVFPVGSIPFNLKKNKGYEILVCKVGVGKSYCISADQHKNQQMKLPKGFDSLYIYNSPDGDAKNPRQFKNDYMIYDNAQVLPSYVIHFELDFDKEERMRIPLCDICHETPAVFYCKSDDACLCADCDDDFHNKGGTLTAKHQRVPVSERPKSLGQCGAHPDNTLEYYCQVCSVTLCVYCKISGSHSTGEATSHPLIRLSDAYQKSLQQAKEIDPELEKKKTLLKTLLKEIDSRINEVNRNAGALEEQIYQVLQELLNTLRSEIQKKMSFLIADQFEIKRELDYIYWTEAFQRYQQMTMEPSEFISNWAKHQILKNEILNSNPPMLSNVSGNLRLDGRLKILNDDQARTSFLEEKMLAKGEVEVKVNNPSSKLRSDIFNKMSRYVTNNNLMQDGDPSRQRLVPNSGNSPGYGDEMGEFDSKRSYRFTELQKNVKKDPGEKKFTVNFPQEETIVSMEKLDGIRKLTEYAKTTLGFYKAKMNPSVLENILRGRMTGSSILSPKEREMMFLNLPFVEQAGQINAPELDLIYSGDGSAAKTISFQQMFVNHQTASLWIFAKGDRVFGGYASHPFNNTSSKFFGDGTCFLFNINADTRIQPLKDRSNLVYLWQNKNTISWGRTDLVIEESFGKCSSELENCYTAGSKATNDGPKTFLAGSYVFQPDAVEVWSVSFPII